MEEERLADLHLLTSVQDLGPVAALEIYRHNIAPGDLLARPERYPLEGKRASKVIAGIRALKTADRQQARDFARTQVARAKALGVLILTYDHPHYPPLVRQSNNPQPLLWARGASSVLTGRDSVACVGSREIRSPYAELHRDFASVACAENFTIVSGFALGADSIGHRAALASSGRTVCVLPCGVDLVFPPENRELWKQLMASERALFISEFPLGRRAESLTLRKRNKLIVAAARGVMVSQTSEKGGAMNAYRFALEQKKQLATFEADGTEGTGGNEVIRRETSVRTIAFPASAIDASQRYAKWLRGL
jgi:DNA processing protein